LKDVEDEEDQESAGKYLKAMALKGVEDVRGSRICR
jgi:hypothetical protein